MAVYKLNMCVNHVFLVWKYSVYGYILRNNLNSPKNSNFPRTYSLKLETTLQIIHNLYLMNLETFVLIITHRVSLLMLMSVYNENDLW